MPLNMMGKRVVFVSTEQRVISVDEVEGIIMIDCEITLMYTPHKVVTKADYCPSSLSDSNNSAEVVLSRVEYGGDAGDIVIANCRTAEEQFHKYTLFVKENLIKVYKNLILTVNFSPDLHRFPWDRQAPLLRLLFRNCTVQKWDSWRLPQVRKLYTVKVECSEWKLCGVHVELDGSWMKTTIFMERYSAFYILNYMFFIFSIASLNVTTLTIPTSDIVGRSSITMTLILTLMALKFVIASNVPIVPYMTLFDIYNMLGFLCLLFGAFVNMLLSDGMLEWTKMDPEIAEDINKWWAILFSSVWIGLHVLLLLANFTGVLRKPWKACMREMKVNKRIADGDGEGFSMRVHGPSKENSAPQSSDTMISVVTPQDNNRIFISAAQLDAKLDELAVNKGAQTVFVHFTAKYVKGQKWCPDCRSADAVIETTLANNPTLLDGAIMIDVEIDRASWKNQNKPHRFRSPPYNVQGIPTMIRYDYDNVTDQLLPGSRMTEADLLEEADLACFLQNPSL